MLTLQAYLIWRFRPIYTAPPPGTSLFSVVLLTAADLTIAVALVFSALGYAPVEGAYLVALAFNLFAAGLMSVRFVLRG